MIKDNINLSVGYNTEMCSYQEALTDFTEAKEGYIYPLDDLSLTVDEYKLFMEDLVNEFKDIKRYDYSSGTNTFIKLKHPNFSMYIRGNSKDRFLMTQCANEETSQFIFNLHKKHKSEKSETQIFVTTYSEKDANTKVYDKDEFNNISKLYYPYIDTEVMFQQYFTGNENILLLVGKPGLGKSKMVSLMLDYAAHNLNILPYDKTDIDSEIDVISVGVVKSAKVLATETFWNKMEQAEHDFVILDDLDFMLTKREAEVSTSDDQIKNMFLSYFLPFTDGIDQNKTKFIITTNQTYENIDSALLRKGRLFDILELRDLSRDEALDIWLDNNLAKDGFLEIFDGKHDIQPADLGSEISKKLNTRITTNNKSYLLEDGISKTSNAKRIKKIGL